MRCGVKRGPDVKQHPTSLLPALTPALPTHPCCVHPPHSQVNHTFNENQISWFKAGSALNAMAAQFKAAEQSGKADEFAAKM